MADDKAPCRHGIRAGDCLACRENSHGVHGHRAKAGRTTPVPSSGASGADGRGCSTFQASGSMDGDAVMRYASLQHKLVKRVDAASEALVPSLEPADAAAAMPQADEEDAAGWALVREHNSDNACWIVIDGRVLDVTAYLGHHPGGSSIIQQLAGRDATRAYERANHSRGADMKLADFTIGKLGDLKRLRRAAREAREYRERLEAAAEYL